jgi:hypothetical protein
MACDLEFEGPIVRLRIVLDVIRTKSDGPPVAILPTQINQLVNEERRADFQEEMSGIVRRAFASSNVKVEMYDVEPGSVTLLLVIVAIGRLVIDAGGFLAGLREIKQAVPDRVSAFVQRLAGQPGEPAHAAVRDTRVEFAAGVLEGTVTQDTSAPKPSPIETPPALVLLAITIVLMAVAIIVLAALT